MGGTSCCRHDGIKSKSKSKDRRCRTSTDACLHVHSNPHLAQRMERCCWRCGKDIFHSDDNQQHLMDRVAAEIMPSPLHAIVSVPSLVIGSGRCPSIVDFSLEFNPGLIARWSSIVLALGRPPRFGELK